MRARQGVEVKATLDNGPQKPEGDRSPTGSWSRRRETGIEAGPGINWYFSGNHNGGNHNGKVQLDVAWVDISNDLPVQTENLRLASGNAAFSSTAAGFAEGEQGILTRFQVQVGF